MSHHCPGAIGSPPLGARAARACSGVCPDRAGARGALARARVEIRTWRSAIADLRTPPPGAPSGALGEGNPGWVWRCDAAISRYNEKTCLLGRFFTCSSQKYQNGAISVNTEDFRPCLSKPSCRAPKWDLMARLMQKERLKSPLKSPIIENQACWVIFAILARTDDGELIKPRLRASS